MRAIVGDERIAEIVRRWHDLAVDEAGCQVLPQLARGLAQQVQHDIRAHETDIGDRNVPSRQSRVADEGAAGTIDSDGNHRVCARIAQDSHLRAHVAFEGLIPPVGDGFDNLEIELGQRGGHADFAALPVGIGLAEKPDPAKAHGVKVTDQRACFFAIGCTNIEHEPVVGRRALRIGTAERRHVDDLFFLVVFQQRQDAREGRCTDVIEEEEDPVLLDQVMSILNGGIRLVLVILEDDRDSLAVDSAAVIDAVEICP